MEEVTNTCENTDFEGYISDSYKTNLRRTYRLKKIKSKKEREETIGFKKKHKSTPPELIQVADLQKQLEGHYPNAEERLKLFQDVKFVKHIVENFESEVNTDGLCFVYLYHHWSYYAFEGLFAFLTAAYGIKTTLGKRCTFAMSNVSLYGRVYNKFSQCSSIKYILFDHGKIVYEHGDLLPADKLKATVEKAYNKICEEKKENKRHECGKVKKNEYVVRQK